MIILRLFKFYYLFFKRFLLGKISNIIVYYHVKLTPDKSTEDTLREIILQQLRNIQRKIEIRRYDLMEDMKRIAIDMNIDPNLDDNEIEKLAEERRIKDERDYARYNIK